MLLMPTWSRTLMLLQWEVEDGAKAALVKSFEESQVILVGDPRFAAVQWGGENSGLVHIDLGAGLQVLAAPDSLVESAECTVHFCQSIVNLLVEFCVSRDGAPQVCKLLDCLQLCLPDGDVRRMVLFLRSWLVENFSLLQAHLQSEELSSLCKAGCYAL